MNSIDQCTFRVYADGSLIGVRGPNLQVVWDGAHALVQAPAVFALTRDLLARLSHDYGDGEDCPEDVQRLFDRGEKLLPIEAQQ